MALTLSDIRKAADKKFAPWSLDLEDGKAPVVLKNPVRLDKKVRDSVKTLQEDLQKPGAELGDVVGQILAKIADTPAQGKRLVDAADGDAAVLLQMLNSWMEGEDVGEASASQD